MADWAALLAEHGPRVWRTAFRILNHHADAHDCYQDVFLAACQIAPRDPADWGRILTCLATRKAIDRLRAGLAGLPGKQAEVVWLSCVERLTHREIADQLRIPTGEVRVLLHRGLQRLREHLAPDLTDTWRPS